MTPKDLTKEFPRSPYEELAGFPWLARMIDKVRALHAGTLGEYTPYPCGGDKGFLAVIGVDPDALKAVITGGASDEAIAQWVKDHATPGVQERLDTYRQRQRSAVNPDYKDYFEKNKAELAEQYPDRDFSKAINFSETICIEEGHPLPARV